MAKLSKLLLKSILIASGLVLDEPLNHAGVDACLKSIRVSHVMCYLM